MAITNRRVVITGVGTINPLGNNIKSYWEAISKGVSGAAPIKAFDTKNYKTKFACEIKNYDPLDFFDAKEMGRTDRFSQIIIIAAQQAVEDAGLKGIKDEKLLSRIGVITGSGIGGLISFQREVLDLAFNDMKPRISPFFIPKMIIDIAAGLISMRYGYMGPNYSSVSACASSSNAIMDASNMIRMGNADIMLSGGSEAVICESGIGGFNAMKALSTRNDDPATASRPYDKHRDGFVMGEGAGMVVLEELEHAKKRGAHIYAELMGIGSTGDAYHLTAPHPEGLGALRAMKMALDNSNLNIEDVDYINTHGTSTLIGDIAELKAIRGLFKDYSYKMNISSTKSMTGHLLGAAGIVELLACILSIKKGIIPPTINHFVDDEEIDPKLNLTFNEAQERKVDVVLSNTFGFGGHNACLILKKYS